ncbi:hypothetical protein QR685DRAFT_452578, partial [Neurospora intermedia]
FQKYCISRRTGFKILAQKDRDDGRTFYSTYFETKGKKKTFTKEIFLKLKEFIINYNFNSRTIPYKGLPNTTGIDLS